MDNIFMDNDMLVNSSIVGVFKFLNESDLNFINRICGNSVKAKNRLDVIDYIDLEYIRTELELIDDIDLREKLYTLILINYSFDLTFNLYDNKTISRLFSLDININKEIFDSVSFKYGDKDLKLKDKLTFSLQKNMNIKLLEFLIKHYSNELSFEHYKIVPDLLYKSSLYKEFIIKALDINLFNMNNLNIKCSYDKCSALDYIGRDKVFNELKEDPDKKESFIFLYGLGVEYDENKLSKEYKKLIDDIKKSRSELNKNKENLSNTLKELNLSSKSDSFDIVQQGSIALKQLEDIKISIEKILHEIKLGEIELRRQSL